MIAFFVPGIPVAQGSKIAGVTNKGVPYMRESADAKLRPWRKAITEAAREARRGQKIVGPVWLSLVFTFPPLKSDPDRKYAHKAQDIDKLTRAVCDALTQAEVWEDDARVCHLEVMKTHDEQAGVSVLVKPLTNDVVNERTAA